MASSFPLVPALGSISAEPVGMNGTMVFAPLPASITASAPTVGFSSRTADVARYLALVTSEHADKPNFMAWLTYLLCMVDDATACASSFNDALDLDSAAGVQLDLLGSIVGVARTLDFQPSDGSSAVVDDDTYRLMLRAKIARNHWDGTITGIQSLWADLFGSVPAYLVLHDNQDMTMTAIVIGLASAIQQDLVNHGYILPKPQGVGLLVSTPTNKLFALGIESSAFGGLGEGYWVQYSGL